MRFRLLSYQEAKFLHQGYYDKEFEVMSVVRRGYWDFFPLSFLYGLSDWGSWDGLISTDGSKVVVSKTKYISTEEVEMVFTIPIENIVQSEIKGGSFNWINIAKPVKGLTRTKLNGVVKLIGLLTIYPILLLLYFEFFSGRNTYFFFEIEEDYNSLDKFTRLLMNSNKVK